MYALKKVEKYRRSNLTSQASVTNIEKPTQSTRTKKRRSFLEEFSAFFVEKIKKSTRNCLRVKFVISNARRAKKLKHVSQIVPRFAENASVQTKWHN